MHHQEGSLQAVCEGNPGQVPKHQHEAKTIVHDVHGCQNSLLFKHSTDYVQGNQRYVNLEHQKINVRAILGDIFLPFFPYNST